MQVCLTVLFLLMKGSFVGISIGKQYGLREEVSVTIILVLLQQDIAEPLPSWIGDGSLFQLSLKISYKTNTISEC